MLSKLNSLKSKVIDKAKSRSSRHSDRFIVALDIGTENVKALIAKITEDGADIIGTGRAHQNLSDMQAGAIADIAAVTANCNKALADAEKQAGVSARAVIIGIAGELVKGTTINIKVQRKDAKKPLDIEEVEKIVGLVQKRAYDRASKQIALELGGKEVEVQLVNSALVSMNIDGYEVTNPVGFKGKEIQIQLYTAFAPMIHIGALEQVARQLDMDLLAVAAEPFAVARSVIGDLEDSTMSAILMDVGGGTTDIAVLNEGGVQGTQMFGIGGRAFTKSIAKDIDVGFSEAEKLKLSLGEGSAPKQMTDKIEKALTKTVKVWRSGVELALGEYDTLKHLPHQILLCGGGASLAMLTEELESNDWYRKLPFARKPSIQFIDPQTVVGINDTTDTLNDQTFVTAIGLLRVGLDTISQNNLVDEEVNIKTRLNRLLRI